MSKPVELTAIESDYSANIYGWQDSDKNYTFIGDRLIVSSVNNFAPGSPYTPESTLTLRDDISFGSDTTMLLIKNINEGNTVNCGIKISVRDSDNERYTRATLVSSNVSSQHYLSEVGSFNLDRVSDFNDHTWIGADHRWKRASLAGADEMYFNASTGDLTITGTLYSDGLSVTGSLSSGSVSSGDLTVSGNLTVNGTTTTINSTTLTVNDLKITLADGAPNSAAADGAGIEIAGANAEITYASTGDKWTMNKPLDMGSNNITTTGTITYNTLNDGTTALTSSVAELNYTSGVTSNIQTQLDNIRSDYAKSIMMGMIFG